MKITTHVDNGLNLGLTEHGSPVLIVGETRLSGDELIEVSAEVLARLLVAFAAATYVLAQPAITSPSSSGSPVN